MSVGRRRISDTRRIVHIVSLSKWLTAVFTILFLKWIKLRDKTETIVLVLELLPVGGHRIRGTGTIVHIILCSNWKNVVVTNSIPQVYKTRSLSRKNSTCIGNIMSVR